MKAISFIIIICISYMGFSQSPFNSTYGTSNFDVGGFIDSHLDSMFLISLVSEYQSNKYHSYIIEIDATGNKLKSNVTNNNVNQISVFKEYYETSDFINVGIYENNSNFDFLIQKTDTSGNEVWIKHYGGSQLDFAWDFEILSDSGFLIVGTTESFGAGDRDIYIIRTDKNGDSLWTKTYGDTRSQTAYGIEKESDSVYVVAGTWGNTQTNSGDIFIMKINLHGDTLLFKLHDIGNLQNFGHSLCKSSDGGYVVAGVLEHYFGSYIGFMPGIYKMDNNLNLQWAKYYGNPYDGEAFDIKECYDHGFIMVGYSEQYPNGEDVYIVRTDSIGDTLWTKTLGGAYDDRAYSVVQTPDSGFAIVGNTYSYGAGGSDAFFLKIKPNGDITVSNGFIPELKELGIKVYPNPASDFIVINTLEPLPKSKLQIFDLQGKLLLQKEITENTFNYRLDIRNIKSGIYFLKIQNANIKGLSKLVISR